MKTPPPTEEDNVDKSKKFLKDIINEKRKPTKEKLADKYIEALDAMRNSIASVVGQQQAESYWTAGIPDTRAFATNLLETEFASNAARAEFIESSFRMADDLKKDAERTKFVIEYGFSSDGLASLAVEDTKFQAFYKDVVAWNDQRDTDSNLAARVEKYWEKTPRKYTSDIPTDELLNDGRASAITSQSTKSWVR